MPIVLTLPDGATRQVEPGTPARDVVATIGSRLLRDAIAVSVDGEVQDLMNPYNGISPFGFNGRFIWGRVSYGL